MLLKYTLILLGLTFAISACNLDRRERQLRSRERTLARRQRQFAANQSDYQALLLTRDSLLQQDKKSSPVGWAASIEGVWRAELVCTHAGCGWAVGDQLWQDWNFTATSTGLFVIVADQRRGPRVLKGNFSGKELSLTYLNEQLPERTMAKSVRLTAEQHNRMRGERRISIKGCCEAVFSVELIRNSSL